MKLLQHIGIGLFVIALLIFTAMLGIGKQELRSDNIGISNAYHKDAIIKSATELGVFEKEMGGVAFTQKIKSVIKNAAADLESQAQNGLPDGVSEWDFKLGSWKVTEYTEALVKQTASGPVQERPWLFFMLTFGLAILGGLLFILPKFMETPGIKNNGIYHDPLTRGLAFNTNCLLYTSPSPRDRQKSRMPSSA